MSTYPTQSSTKAEFSSYSTFFFRLIYELVDVKLPNLPIPKIILASSPLGEGPCNFPPPGAGSGMRLDWLDWTLTQWKT